MGMVNLISMCISMIMKGIGFIVKSTPKVISFLYRTGLHWFAIGCFVLNLGMKKAIPENLFTVTLVIILVFVAPVIAIINRIASAVMKQKINIIKSAGEKIYESVTGKMVSDVEKNGHVSKTKDLFKEPCGTVLAYKNSSKYICIPDDKIYHGALVGGTGSGKTVFLTATLLTNPHAMLVVDCKDGGELRRITGNIRKNRLKHEIKFFNPEDENTYKFDPYCVFDFMGNESETDIADFLACSMIDKRPDDKAPVWCDNARILLAGIILYCRQNNNLSSFYKTMEFIQTHSAKNAIAEIKGAFNKKSDIYMSAWKKLSFFDGMAEETLSSVESNMRSKLSCFTSEKVMSALSDDTSDAIRPEDLEKKNCTIYYNVSLAKTSDQWQALSRLFFNVFFAYFSRRGEKMAEQREKPEKIFFILDEFTNVGKIENFDTQVSLVRSAGISVLIAFQSLGQLFKVYGRDTTQILLDNMSYDVVLNCKDPESQLYFAKLSGKYEKKKKSKSSNYNATMVGTGTGTGSGQNETSEEHYLFREDTFAYLQNENKCIVYLPDGVKKCEKVLYYKDKYFTEILNQHSRKESNNG